MKFAKELERDLVPEWRLKYLDYKTGKKKLKAIRRALRTVNQTPRLRLRAGNTYTPSPFESAPKYSFLNRNHGKNASTSRDPEDLRAIAIGRSQSAARDGANGSREGLSGAEPKDEEAPLNAQEDPRYPGLTRYGSIIGTPPKDGSPMNKGKRPPSLQLPGAALDPDSSSPTVGPSTNLLSSRSNSRPADEVDGGTNNAFEVGETRSPTTPKTLPARYKSIFTPKRINSTPGAPVSETPRPLPKRVFSLSYNTPQAAANDVPLEAYRELDTRQAEFFHFLDMELDKIEKFYKQKEDEATERLAVLRKQLHMMADRRLTSLIDRHTAKIKAKADKNGGVGRPLTGDQDADENEGANSASNGVAISTSWLIDSALQAVQAGKYGKSTKAMQGLATPSALRPMEVEDRGDYQRKPEESHVPYQTAKRKLKVAMQEYYRGLELLKSYALLNRTAFRKISKKYDKTVHARPSLRYMSEKVNQAWFVNSDIIEGHIHAVEDLYARYFEKGNHKVAVNRLRIKIARAGDYTENSFRNGLMLGLGAVFGVQGIVKAVQLLYANDDPFHTNISYLLQIYGGYFFMTFLFMLFCLDCRVWSTHKINYVFVFEYDTRHHLDWRQLFELPCFFFFLLGFFVWLNFSQHGNPALFLYYPVILIGLTVIILFVPLKILYYRSRLWLLFSMWRLICAGYYPIEWRDFYMGDMFCSLTYSMGNIELLPCLYAHGWRNPSQCNSSNSRLLGFFTTLPGIWRAIQCYRRYHDSGNAFPHLLNLGKYTATIVFYMVLSIYRIDKSTTNRALFITFATINSIYCSFWDVYYDWSLGDPNAKHPFLRQTLGYKRAWWYYAAMVIDPILRFNWIVYAVDPLQLQHSAITSFCVALSEILRRGMWSLFRVENEHCSNVGHFRASRDVPLPYEITTTQQAESEAEVDGRHARTDEEQPISRPASSHTTSSAHATGANLAHTQSHSSSVRHRRSASDQASYKPSPLTRGLTRIGTIMRTAHAQDFEKRKKPELGAEADGTKVEDDDSDDDDDDEPEENSGRATTSRGSGAEVLVAADMQSAREIEEARGHVAMGRAEGSGSGSR